MRALFSYDNMTVTLSHGSVFTRLSVITADGNTDSGIVHHSPPSTGRSTCLAKQHFAGTSNTEAGHPVVYYCLHT